MPRRQRKQAKKRLVELLALTLDPAARRVLESIRHPSHAGAEDGFQVGTGGFLYGAQGDPPPAETVIAIAETLAGIAAKIETILGTST